MMMMMTIESGFPSSEILEIRVLDLGKAALTGSDEQ
jgi:hypothetical protein